MPKSKSRIALDAFVSVGAPEPGYTNREEFTSRLSVEILTSGVRLRQGLYRVILEKIPEPEASRFPHHDMTGDRDEQ